jgi:hypothetical protein
VLNPVEDGRYGDAAHLHQSFRRDFPLVEVAAQPASDEPIENVIVSSD